MDTFNTDSFEVIITIWAFVSPIVVTSDGHGTYTGTSHTSGYNCDLCCPCQMLNIITAGMSRCDDAVIYIAFADWGFFAGATYFGELNNADNFAEIEVIVASDSFEKGLDNEAIMTRVFTFGAPILQEFGINLLALILYTVMIPMLTFQISRAIANKLDDKIEKVFITSIITIRTFGSIELNCCGLDIGSAFFSTINLWYVIQNTIWATKGVNTLEPGVPFWKPF
nr:6038_t:CDS:2 [Entrophospora candida]